LGTEVVNDAAKEPHLALYLGETDGKGNNYVIRGNMGPYDVTHTSVFFKIPDKQEFAPNPAPDITGNVRAKKILDNLVGDTIIFNETATIFDASQVTGAGTSPDEMVAACQIQIDFANYSIEASKGDYNSLLAKYPGIARMVANPRPGQLNAAEQPYISVFKVANIEG
jgi:hypothetical protein